MRAPERGPLPSFFLSPSFVPHAVAGGIAPAEGAELRQEAQPCLLGEALEPRQGEGQWIYPHLVKSRRKAKQRVARGLLHVTLGTHGNERVFERMNHTLLKAWFHRTHVPFLYLSYLFRSIKYLQFGQWPPPREIAGQ